MIDDCSALPFFLLQLKRASRISRIQLQSQSARFCADTAGQSMLPLSALAACICCPARKTEQVGGEKSSKRKQVTILFFLSLCWTSPACPWHFSQHSPLVVAFDIYGSGLLSRPQLPSVACRVQVRRTLHWPSNVRTSDSLSAHMPPSGLLPAQQPSRVLFRHGLTR